MGCAEGIYDAIELTKKSKQPIQDIGNDRLGLGALEAPKPFEIARIKRLFTVREDIEVKGDVYICVLKYWNT